MRRIALAAALALGCGNPTVERLAAPLDQFFYPTGVAVLDHRVIVASSNADLTYSPTDGGSVIVVAPRDPIACDPVAPSCADRVAGALNIRPFAGELALADRDACPALAAGPDALALVPIRGSDLVYRLDVGNGGTVACEGDCEIGVGSADRGDPFAMGIACDPVVTPGGPSAVARAYVGYLRSSAGQAWITQIDLRRAPTEDGYVQHAYYDAGQVRAFAYDEARHRLYFTRSATGALSTLRYVDLANDCRIDRLYADGGCRSGTSPGTITTPGAVPIGLELRGIALSNVNPTDPAPPVRRAYVTARVYDPVGTATTGGVVDYDGVLIAADLSEDVGGTLRFDIVNQIPIGYGAGYVRVLPPRPGKRDVVATIAMNDGVVWIYDDETRQTVALGRNPSTGAPIVGDGPFELVVDPVPLAGNVARLYVGSFREHFVTPIDVPLDDPAAADIAYTNGDRRLPVRISGGLLP